MYDRAEAARRRILARCAGAGLIGRRYAELANTLMAGPDSHQRTMALSQLADSCDNAIALLEKVRQSRGNSPGSRRSPGQTNG
jgi:hypothetical protein